MKALEYLKQIGIMDARINARLEELESLQALATKVTASMGGERVQSSGSQQKMADCVVKIVEMKQEINEAVDRYVDYKREAMALIESCCDADCIKLLHKRYFLQMTWESIAVELNFTYQWVSGGLHQRALSQVQEGLDRKCLCYGL